MRARTAWAKLFSGKTCTQHTSGKEEHFMVYMQSLRRPQREASGHIQRTDFNNAMTVIGTTVPRIVIGSCIGSCTEPDMNKIDSSV